MEESFPAEGDDPQILPFDGGQGLSAHARDDKQPGSEDTLDPSLGILNPEKRIPARMIKP